MNARFGYELIRGGIALLRQDTTTMSISAVVAKVLSRDASGTVADGYLREALFGLLGAPLHERAPQDGYKGVDSDLGGAWDHDDKIPAGKMSGAHAARLG